MNSNNTNKTDIKKIANITLVVLLILGILCSGFGITVTALNGQNSAVAEVEDDTSSGSSNKGNVQYFDSEATYTDVENEAVLQDNVSVFTETESKDFTKSIIEVTSEKSYYGDENYMNITLRGDEHKKVNDLNDGDIIYVQGDEDSYFGTDRILQIEDTYTYDDKTYIKTKEPYYEDVFDTISVNASDKFTQDNYVNAYMPEGVSAYFSVSRVENADSDVALAAAQEDKSAPVVQTLSMGGGSEVRAETLSSSTVDSNNNITQDEEKITIEIDVDLSKYLKEDDDDDKAIELDGSFGIKGKVELTDLRSHMVFEGSRFGGIENAYIGVSGSINSSVDVYADITLDGSVNNSKIDNKILSMEGLRDKRWPIAVLQFQGVTPVYITNEAFEATRQSVLPTYYLVLYSDWEGKIEFGVQAGFDSVYEFNQGMQLVKDGNFECKMVTGDSDANGGELDRSTEWEAELRVNAETEFTVFGSSVLFYISGINIADVGIGRIGMEAKCDIPLIKLSSENAGFTFPSEQNTSMYLRIFLKIIDIDVKCKIDGKGWFESLGVDVADEFELFDITLYEWGFKADEYKNKTPVSYIDVPSDFDYAVSLVFDVSSSMNGEISTGESKLNAAKKAVQTIVNSTEQTAEKFSANYGMGVVKFSDYAENVTEIHVDYDYIRDCIDLLETYSMTNITDGINYGINQLESVNTPNKIMILMTDGQHTEGDVSEVIDAAKKAGEKDIKIYTIGFGYSSADVDETTLKEVASITGGEYSFASTDNVIGIMGSFMYAQSSASGGSCLVKNSSTVSQGEITEKTYFEVPDKSGVLELQNAWPGSFLDTILVDPNGVVVDENYPNSVTDESTIPSTITIQNPIQGEWSYQIEGVETSYDEEPFYTQVFFKEMDNTKLNGKMSGLQVFAAYCIPIGVFVTLVSAMMIYCVNKKTKTAKN